MAQSINVDMTPGLFMPTLHYSQGDVGREFVINLATRDGMTIPAGATVTMQATKPSGFGFSVTGTLSGTVATFTTTDTMTDEYGRFQAEIVIAQGTTVIGTTNFWLEGEKNPHPDGTTDGSKGTVIPELTLLVERAEAAAGLLLNCSAEATPLAAGSDPTASYDPETGKFSFGIPEGEAGAGASDIIAAPYSTEKAYAVGDYSIHDSKLYRCTVPITTAEAWTASHWVQVVLGDDVSDLKSAINDIAIFPTMDINETVAYSCPVSAITDRFVSTWELGDIRQGQQLYWNVDEVSASAHSTDFTKLTIRAIQYDSDNTVLSRVTYPSTLNINASAAKVAFGVFYSKSATSGEGGSTFAETFTVKFQTSYDGVFSPTIRELNALLTEDGDIWGV